MTRGPSEPSGDRAPDADANSDDDLAEAEIVDEHDVDEPAPDVDERDVDSPVVPASALAVGIEADDATVSPIDLDDTGPRYPGDTGVRYDRESSGTSTRTSTKGRPAWREGNMLVVILAMAALVVGGGIAALIVTLTSGGDSTELGKPDVSGSLPSVQQSGPDPAAGVKVPDISGTDLNEQPLTVANDGRPHVLLVMAHWCPHCQTAVPQLVKLNQQGAMNGISFYGIVSAITPEGDNYPPSDWLHRENWPFPTFLDNADNEIAQKLGVTAFPFYVFVDKDGNVLLRLTGDLTDAQLTALFSALANGQRLPVTVGGGSSSSQPPATTAPATTTTRR